MSLPNKKFKPKSGCFFEQNGRMMWKEYMSTYGDKFELHEILELENFARECQFKIVFVREKNDMETFQTVKRFFAQDIAVKIRDDVSSNIVLRYDNKLWFLSDISSLGTTEICPLTSDSVCVVTKSSPYPITREMAAEIMKTSARAFGRVDESNSELQFYVTC